CAWPASFAFGSFALIVFQAQSVRFRPCASDRLPISATTGWVMLFFFAHATDALPTSTPACLCEKRTFCVAPLTACVQWLMNTAPASTAFLTEFSQADMLSPVERMSTP